MIVPASTGPSATRPVRPAVPSAEPGRPHFASVFDGGEVGNEPTATAPSAKPSPEAGAVAGLERQPASTAGTAPTKEAAALDAWASERFGFDHFANLGSRARHGAQGLRWR